MRERACACTCARVCCCHGSLSAHTLKEPLRIEGDNRASSGGVEKSGWKVRGGRTDEARRGRRTRPGTEQGAMSRGRRRSPMEVREAGAQGRAQRAALGRRSLPGSPLPAGWRWGPRARASFVERQELHSGHEARAGPREGFSCQEGGRCSVLLSYLKMQTLKILPAPTLRLMRKGGEMAEPSYWVPKSRAETPAARGRLARLRAGARAFSYLERRDEGSGAAQQLTVLEDFRPLDSLGCRKFQKLLTKTRE